MLCQCCHRPGRGRLCPQCRAHLNPAHQRVLPGGVRLVAAFEHTGPAKRLVHDLKYRGVLWYADLVASLLAPVIPDGPITAIPRAWSRLLRYGIDPAREIALRLARLKGVSYEDLFRRPWHGRRRAGGDHSSSPSPLALRGPSPSGLILVDDVVTTGATLEMALETIGRERVRIAVAANAAGRPSTLLGGRVDQEPTPMFPAR